MAYSEQQKAIIAELSARFEDVLVPVRLGQDVSRDAIWRLLRTVEQVGCEWSRSSDIPKEVARLFVDARALLHGSALNYPEDIRRELRHVASALSGAISRALSETGEKSPAE